MPLNLHCAEVSINFCNNLADCLVQATGQNFFPTCGYALAAQRPVFVSDLGTAVADLCDVATMSSVSRVDRPAPGDWLDLCHASRHKKYLFLSLSFCVRRFRFGNDLQDGTGLRSFWMEVLRT